MNYFKKGQVGVEYLIIMGFLTFVIIGIMGVAFSFSGLVRDRLVITQASNFANKIISTAESVYYEGEPSKATISVYLPEQVTNVRVEDNMLVLTISTSSGENLMGFSSNVPISQPALEEDRLSSTSGIKTVVITARTNDVQISH
jgi:Flp pilus assembly protein TadG